MKFLSCPLNPSEGRKTEVGDSDWGHGGGDGGGVGGQRLKGTELKKKVSEQERERG